MKGNINISDFLKKQIYKQENVSNLWRIDNLIVRNKFLYQKWNKKYKCSFANCLLDEVDNIEVLYNKYTLEYFLTLFQSSDGEYAENISNRIVSIFYGSPDFILENVNSLIAVQDKIIAVLCYMLPNKERAKLRKIYLNFTRKEAEQIIKWLSCN